jgi:hypothetical protein
MRRAILMGFCVLLGCSAAAWGAGVYKWVDEDGQIHYGDRPQGEDVESVKTAPAPSSVPPAATAEEDRLEKQRRLLDAYEKERRDQQAAAEKARAEEEQRQKNCAQARDRLRRFEQAGYLYDLDDNGERVILSDAERARRTDEARREVARWCE